MCQHIGFWDLGGELGNNSDIQNVPMNLPHVEMLMGLTQKTKGRNSINYVGYEPKQMT